METVRMNFTLLLLVVVISSTIEMGTANRNLFAADIFQKVATGKDENVIFSPVSIQTCLAMAYFGAGGKTAQELQSGLKLGSGNREEIAKNFEEFTKNSFKKSKDDNKVQLRMANRIYVNQNSRVNPKFNEITERALQSKAEQVNFADSANAVKKINGFVEEQTQNKIKNLLQDGSVDRDTSMVLVNAIYFKGKWEIPFSAVLTNKQNFKAHGKNNVEVDTMFMEEDVRHGEIADLGAQVLELAYANSNLSMMIILPNQVDGLQRVEEKLAGKDLNEISSKLDEHSVMIHLPKFRIEFELDLKGPLKELGLQTMFTDAADFSNLLEDAPNQKVSEARHKAFIDVNEAGSEAAAATFMKIIPMSAPLNVRTFRADRPFIFAIRDPSAVYFTGHVVNPKA